MSMKQIKTFPRNFWRKHPITSKSGYVGCFNMPVETITRDTEPNMWAEFKPEKFGGPVETIIAVCKKLHDAHEANKEAVGWVYNPVTGQSEVIGCSEVGIYANILTYRHDLVAKMEATKREALGDKYQELMREALGKTGQQIIKKERTRKVDFVEEEEIPAPSDKDDPERIVITVEYTKDGKPHHFRARASHLPGDFVCVKSDRKYKNVKVLTCETHPESWIAAKAKEIGYPDIYEVFLDCAIEDKDAWAEYRASEQMQSVPCNEEKEEVEYLDEAPEGWSLD